MTDDAGHSPDIIIISILFSSELWCGGQWAVCFEDPGTSEGM